MEEHQATTGETVDDMTHGVTGIDWRTPSPLLASDLLSCYPREMARKRRMHMRKVLRLTVLAGLMVLFGAAEDGVVFGIGSAQARIGRPLTPMSYAGVARRTTRRAYRRGYYYGHYY
jgi:hypothetical protein